jgi:hypothetical protein
MQREYKVVCEKDIAPYEELMFSILQKRYVIKLGPQGCQRGNVFYYNIGTRAHRFIGGAGSTRSSARIASREPDAALDAALRESQAMADAAKSVAEQQDMAGHLQESVALIQVHSTQVSRFSLSLLEYVCPQLTHSLSRSLASRSLLR